MMKSIQRFLYFLSALLFITSCQKKDWDEYYGRPDDLAPPIYQQLQARGNFKHLLSVIDKSGYKDILGKAGSWTFFAPNDAAFEKYFQKKGINSAEQLTSDDAKKIALYSLVYNPYRKDQLSNFQTSAGPDTNAAFRRKTAYYDFVFTENGKKVVNNSRNGVVYVPNENNNKHIPYFIDSYLLKNNLSSEDYKSFYPNSEFGGFSVADAKVVAYDIPAENGIIHEIDNVVEALPNIDQYLTSKPEYSDFKALLDKYVLYVENPDFTKRYNVLTGSTEKVYIKSYDGLLAFSPNNEGFLGASTDGQSNSWSIAVPTNSELHKYTDDILKYYKTFDAAPASILINFINSHMWTSPLWPSLINDTENSQLEVATFTPQNVIEKKVLSNGYFYGVNKPQEANVFRTVYGHAYLNPDYIFMTRAIDGAADLYDYVKAPNVGATVFLISDASMIAAGYRFNPDTQSWGYESPGLPIDYTAAALARVNRLVQTSILTSEVTSFAGEGVLEAFNGEYIKYKDGQLAASGNVAEGSVVTIQETRTAKNGNAYVTNGMLKFAEENINLGYTLKQLANSTDINISNKYSHFYKYLEGSALWTNPVTTTIEGVEKGAFYTMFVPSNAAIEQAVKDGRLPGDKNTGAPKFTVASQTPFEKDAVERMIKYSIMNMPANSSVAIDGQKSGNFTSLLKNAVNDSRILTVSYPNPANPIPSTMQLLDDASVPNVATVNLGQSNNLSNKALIHSINNVLKF